MKFFSLLSLSKKLFLLVIITVLPGLSILVYSGLEQRQQSIHNATKDVLQLTQAMAEVQKDITNTTKQILSTLSLIPEIQNLDLYESSEIFKSVLKRNQDYNNIILLDVNGNVLTAGKTFAGKNLADRKHIREVIEQKSFTVGEFILSRGGDMRPIFPFAYPVFDKTGRFNAILTTAVKLSSFSSLNNLTPLPAKSFFGVTDHQGIRIFYYPPQEKTNPIGKPISAKSWEKARTAEKGTFSNTGSDGMRRIFAFRQVRLSPEATPYLYVWAGVPEIHVLAQANEDLLRNLLLIFVAMMVSLFLARLVGLKTIIAPIESLVELTHKFSAGDLEARSKTTTEAKEFGVLFKAFYNMAKILRDNQDQLRENEQRFRHLMDSMNALVYVADMNTYELLFINEYWKNIFGDIVGKICWKTLQKGQENPCDFCTNMYLLDKDGNPGDVYTWEFQNTVTKKWFFIFDRAIRWSDGRIVRLEIATDISDRKQAELVKEALIEKLEKTISEIKTLRGFLPICASCKKIRDDKGYWNQIESYIQNHSDAEFSHGICPGCAKKLYPNLVDENGDFK